MSKKPAPKKKPGSQADGVRGTLWYFEPHELTIVGHDTDEQEHELCDAQSNAFAAEQYTELNLDKIFSGEPRLDFEAWKALRDAKARAVRGGNA